MEKQTKQFKSHSCVKILGMQQMKDRSKTTIRRRIKLSRQLDKETPGWQENTTILLDNAKWHTNPLMRERLAKMELPISYSAPYCYSTAPIERVFGALKLGDLNPNRLSTGKK